MSNGLSDLTLGCFAGWMVTVYVIQSIMGDFGIFDWAMVFIGSGAIGYHGFRLDRAEGRV